MQSYNSLNYENPALVQFRLKKWSFSFNISEGKGIIFNPLRLVLAWNRFLSILENCTVGESINNLL